jgi:aerobic carbon-monoxide dehydrogenase small subunit
MLALKINGRNVNAEVEPRTHLADFVREGQNLTGTHLGCEHGVCGACTILVDGVPVRSCITYAVSCNGASITTIEGLDDDEIAKELRAAFSREHALQCGYCTPGMLISARDLVLRVYAASEHDVRVAMSGNLCRCTGYVGIIDAICSVIADRRARGITAIPGAGRSALGPAGCDHGHGADTPEAAARAVPDVAARREAQDALAVGENVPANFTPQASFDQSFVVHHPVEEVWNFFANVPAVAACLPGASITGDAGARIVNGKMRVKVGPIAAEFHGSAEIDRDPAHRSGTIRGSGQDRRSSSATQGVIRYRLLAVDQQSTQVELSVGYRLTGTLAQFSRSDLVQDIASRLIALFAQNLEARLAAPEQALRPAPELKAIPLLFSVLAKWTGARLTRLFAKSERN